MKRNKTTMKHRPTLALALLVAGCAPQLSLDGHMVRVGDPEGIKRCDQLANTRIALGKFHATLLSGEKIAEALENEARNLAKRIGGDTVLPTSNIEDARQAFGIYVCRKPADN